MAYFGDLNSGGNNVQAPPNNDKAASKFTLAFDALVDKLFIRYNSYTSGHAKAIIYDSTGVGGLPGAFIAQSTEVTTGTSSSVNAFTFSPSVSLTAAGGPYWIGVWSDAATSTSLCQTLSNGVVFNANTYSSGGSPSNPFGASPSTANDQYPILARYRPSLTGGTYSGELVGADDPNNTISYTANTLKVLQLDASNIAGSSITSVTFFLSVASAGAKVKVVVYDNTGTAGKPGSLLGSSAEQVGVAIGANTISLPSPVSFTGQPYIGVFTDTTLTSYFRVDATRADYTGSSTYSGGVPGTFPTPSSSTSQPALWANGTFNVAALPRVRSGEQFWGWIAEPELEPDWLPRKAPAIASASVASASFAQKKRPWWALLDPDEASEWLPHRRFEKMAGFAGAGGLYGGGGGGSGSGNVHIGGGGADGLIIITYTPSG